MPPGGFPALQKLTKAYENDSRVKFIAIQTVFEGYEFNSREKLRKNQLEWGLQIPMAHAPGNPQTHEIPAIMKKYRSGGTPWAILIDPNGTVVYNYFHIEPEQAAALIEQMLSKANIN